MIEGSIEEIERFIESEWCAALQAAYSLARGERLNVLQNRHVKRFDARGLHPYSEVWGRIRALEALLPTLMLAEADPIALRRAAESDAAEQFASELLEAMRGDESC
jgi:hypothetical protein